MEGKSDSICPACGSHFIITYYQRRAADEPPDRVKYCENCPLDPQRLELKVFSASIIAPTEGHGRRLDSRYRSSASRPRSTSARNASKGLQTVSISQPVVVSKLTRIKFKGATATSCLRELRQGAHRAVAETGKMTRVTKQGVVKVAIAHSSGSHAGHTLYALESAFLAPFIDCLTLEAVETRQTHGQQTDEVVLGLTYDIELPIDGASSYLRTSVNGSDPEIVVDIKFLDSGVTEEHCISIVGVVLQRYGTESSLKRVVDPRLISAMFTQSARAFDSLVAPTTGYSYMWKPDGERYWCVKIGCIWFFCKRLLSARIVGWRLDSHATTSTRAAPVLDLEVLVGHAPILIDVLVDGRGNLTSAMRNLPAILETFLQIERLPFSIHIRRYYPTLALLQSEEKDVGYPVDGAVGIENSSTTIIKIKDVKSIELELTETGDLLTSDGTVVATSSLHDLYPSGSIVEVRFRFQQDKRTVQVLSTLLRTDKRKANDTTVCREILSLAGTLPDAALRRKALLWCSSIRRGLQHIASNIRGSGRVVLDIGSGDGQAVSDYSTDPDVTYLLVEPNSSRCIKLRRRLSERTGVRLQHTTDVTEIWRQISALSKGTLKYLIYEGTLQSLLDAPRSFTTLRSCVRCCVASYSLSYTADPLIALALEGLEVLGCGYMYDKPVDKNCIVNASTVRMENRLDGTASVKWGGDEEYYEPVLLTTKFQRFMTIVPATVLSPMSPDDSELLLSQIVASLFIVTTRRSI